MGRKRILVIDDDEALGRMLRMHFEESGGYQCLIATSGKAGLKLVETYKPDLILLDIMMPGMDGIEVLKRLKGNERTLPVPIVMLTAVKDEGTRRKAIRYYGEEYIEKPFEIDVLKTRVEQILSRWEEW